MLIYILISFFIFLTSFNYLIWLNYNYEGAKIKKTLLFILIISLLLSCFAIVAKIDAIQDPLNLWYIVLQFIFCLLGIANFKLFKKYDFLGNLNQPVVSKILITLIFASLGYIGFTLIFNLCYDNGTLLNNEGIGHIYGQSIIFFIIPQIFMTAFELLAAIPPEIHKVWYPSSEDDLPDLEKEDLNLILSIELEFTRDPAVNDTLTYKAKAPVSMLFEDWFTFFVHNYNERFDEKPIRMQDKYQNLYGWVFYTKPSFWETKKYIDFEITIKDNKIKDNTTIVAKRVRIS